MSLPSDHPEAIYLHEAGHVIVARELGLEVTSVQAVSGAGGAQFSITGAQMARIGSARRAFEADTIQADKLFELAVDAASDYLTAILGGIAAEGLVVNGAAYVVARSGEDIPTFFALLHTLSPGLAPKQADALWGRTFRKCHEQAWTIVRSHQAKVLALAEALKPGALLTNQDIEDVIAGV